MSWVRAHYILPIHVHMLVEAITTSSWLGRTPENFACSAKLTQYGNQTTTRLGKYGILPIGDAQNQEYAGNAEAQ
jgi:hypothetical protein